MDDLGRSTHTFWEGRYHDAWMPMYRKKETFPKIGEHLGTMFRDPELQKGCKVLTGNLRGDHLHRLLSIPRRLALSQVVGDKAISFNSTAISV